MKNRNFAAFAFLLFTASLAHAQVQSAGSKANNCKVFEKGSKYGVVCNGDTLVPAQYDQITPTKSGFLIAAQNGKYGVLDQSGKVLLPLHYGVISDVSPEGLALVGEAGHAGIVTFQGKVLIPFVFDEVKPIQGGFYLVKKNGLSGMYSENGQVIVPVDYIRLDGAAGRYIRVQQEKSGPYGLYNMAGDLLLPLQFEAIQLAGQFPLLFAREKALLGAYDEKGHLLYAPAFVTVTCPYPLQTVAIVLGTQQKYGLLNTEGVLEQPLMFDQIQLVSAKVPYLQLLKDGLWGIATLEGKMLTPVKYAKLDFDVAALNDNLHQATQIPADVNIIAMAWEDPNGKPVMLDALGKEH